MQEVGHNHVVAHEEVVDLDVEDPGVAGHLLAGKRLDSHEEQVALEVDLHVLGDLHVLVVDLLDLKRDVKQKQIKLQLHCTSHLQRGKFC